MDFRSNIASARSQTVHAIRELHRFDHAGGVHSPHNRLILDNARRYISPGATRAGAAALDAARWERWVTVRQIRETGDALELLDRAWWSLNDRAGRPDVQGARRTLEHAVWMLDSAARGGYRSGYGAPSWLTPAA